MKNIFKHSQKNLLPERSYYKLEGDQNKNEPYTAYYDYRAEGNASSTGLQAWNSGESANFNSGPALNADMYSFGFPGDYNDYNGLN